PDMPPLSCDMLIPLPALCSGTVLLSVFILARRCMPVPDSVDFQCLLLLSFSQPGMGAFVVLPCCMALWSILRSVFVRISAARAVCTVSANAAAPAIAEIVILFICRSLLLMKCGAPSCSPQGHPYPGFRAVRGRPTTVAVMPNLLLRSDKRALLHVQLRDIL